MAFPLQSKNNLGSFYSTGSQFQNKSLIGLPRHSFVSGVSQTLGKSILGKREAKPLIDKSMVSKTQKSEKQEMLTIPKISKSTKQISIASFGDGK